MQDSQQRSVKWRSNAQLVTLLKDHQDLQKLEFAFCLNIFAKRARVASDYSADPAWDRAILFSQAGEEYVKAVPSVVTHYKAADIKMAVFCSFFHHDIFIDWNKSDLDAVLGILNREAIAGTIRWPFAFGRALYDKFNDTAPNNRVDHIPPDEVFPFLDGTPQGVGQVSALVSGPLGLLRSRQKRFFPPPAAMYLWHCSDPGCMAPHRVSFLRSRVAVTEILEKLDEAAYHESGPPSMWGKVLSDLAEGPRGNTLRTYYDVSAIIGECILFEDRTALFQRALRSESAEFLRVTLKEIGQDTKGSAQALAARLDFESQLQLLMTLTDSDLVRLVDRCIFEKAIVVPPNEERRAVTIMPRRYFVETPSVLSSLGLKQAIYGPIVSFCHMVWDAYGKAGAVNDLDWRIKKMNGASTQEVLMQYLRNSPLTTAVTELILSSGRVTTAVIEELQYCGGVDNPDLVSHLLWKIGFEIPRFSDTYGRLRSRLQVFNESVLQIGNVRNEDDREKIRSAGVNLFVSIEQVLEELIVYNIWLLSSDHFLETRFVFYLTDARKLVSQVLGEKLESEFGAFIWNNEGVNTLGTLYRYLQEACVWMRSLFSVDKTPLRRLEADLPHYVGKKEGIFPFYHRVFWPDVQTASLGAFVDDFAQLATKLSQSNAIPIRNGLDHKRPDADFPNGDVMLAFVSKFREALDQADFNRYIPKEFWAMETKQDRAGRVEYEFRDYNQRKCAVYEPSLALGLADISLNNPVLIAPGNLLGHVNATLILGIREDSNFSEYWKDYPRRRSIEFPSAAYDSMLRSASANATEPEGNK